MNNVIIGAVQERPPHQVQTSRCVECEEGVAPASLGPSHAQGTAQPDTRRTASQAPRESLPSCACPWQTSHSCGPRPSTPRCRRCTCSWTACGLSAVRYCTVMSAFRTIHAASVQPENCFLLGNSPAPPATQRYPLLSHPELSRNALCPVRLSRTQPLVVASDLADASGPSVAHAGNASPEAQSRRGFSSLQPAPGGW